MAKQITQTNTQTPKKVTASTEVVMGAAASKLNKALEALRGGYEQLTSFADTLESLQLQIANSEARLTELTEEYKERKRQADVDLQLSIKADAQVAVVNILDGMGKHAVDKEETNRLVKELTDLKNNFDAKVSAEVKKATAIFENQLKNKEEMMVLKFNADQANNTSEIKSLKVQLESATKQASDWKEALDKEREAGVQRQKAGAIQNLNIPTSNGK